MRFARSSTPGRLPGHGMPRVRDWPVWSLPPRVRAFVLLVICADLACTGVAAAAFRFSAGQLALFAALLACGAVTVELTRRAGEPAGVVKDVYAVWELPVVILLPVLYALIIPAIRLALTQWRVKRAPPYRRVFTAAAIGLAYGSASLVFHGILPAGGDPRGYLWRHPAMWLVAAGACGLTQWAVNQGLVLSAIRLADPATKIKATVLGREELHNDATELCAAVLVALGMTVSYLTLIIALPLATLLQRAARRLETTARAALDGADVDGAYVAAYDAYRMSAEALLARQGLRATGGEGSHMTVEDAVSAQFTIDIPAFAKPTFERFRRTRHSAQYFDPDAAPITEADASWALEKAGDALSGVRSVLESAPPGRFDESRQAPTAESGG